MIPIISIIIPTYNRAHIIGETLESILAQSFNHWECIVVDDGSSDTTTDVLSAYIEKDSRFRYFERPAHRLKGPNSCRNIGFEHAYGEYIHWFDSDDLYQPNALESMFAHFKNDDDAVVTKVEKIHLSTNEFIDTNSILSSQLIKDYFVGKITYYVCGPLWKKSFLDAQKDLFDEEIGNLDDWDFNLRMLYANPQITYVDEAFISYRVHPNSFSKELKKINLSEIQSDIKARDKHLLLLKDSPDFSFYQNFVEQRMRFFYKTAMRKRLKGRGVLFREVIKRQINQRKYGGSLKTTLVHILYLITGKGDQLLK